jgi:hypothetical protein
VSRYLLERISSGKESTIGILYSWPEGGKKTFLGFTLEDQYRNIKVADETRIPAGTFRVKLRNDGAMTKTYAEKYTFHKGMLHLQDVPNFSWVYLHVGNTDKHTSGCILVGDGAVQNITQPGKVTESVAAYTRIYQLMLADIEKNGSAQLTIVDIA